MMGSTATSAEHRMPLRLGRWAPLRGRRSERSSLSILGGSFLGDGLCEFSASGCFLALSP
jgi:hypothetical protein